MTQHTLFAASVLYLNSISVTWSARIQIILTFTKLLAITIIIVPGMYQLFKGKSLKSASPHALLYQSSDHPQEPRRHLLFYLYYYFSRTSPGLHTETQLQYLTGFPLPQTKTCTVNITSKPCTSQKTGAHSKHQGISQCPHSSGSEVSSISYGPHFNIRICNLTPHVLLVLFHFTCAFYWSFSDIKLMKLLYGQVSI